MVSEIYRPIVQRVLKSLRTKPEQWEQGQNGKVKADGSQPNCVGNMLMREMVEEFLLPGLQYVTLNDELLPTRAFTLWNDEPERTVEEVIRMLERGLAE